MDDRDRDDGGTGPRASAWARARRYGAAVRYLVRDIERVNLRAISAEHRARGAHEEAEEARRRAARAEDRATHAAERLGVVEDLAKQSAERAAAAERRASDAYRLALQNARAIEELLHAEVILRRDLDAVRESNSPSPPA